MGSLKHFGNFIDKFDLKEQMLSVLEEMESVLVQHAGPYATNCVIGSPYRQISDIDEFTKDGIKILASAVVSEDPIARFIARLCRFIGLAVDARCHDGTTTSMLLFCKLAKIAVNILGMDYASPERMVEVRTLTTTLKYYLDSLDDLKITVDSLTGRFNDMGVACLRNEVLGAVAYHTAMISSKGDHDLSDKIRQLIQNSPVKSYGMFLQRPLAKETSERYILTRQEHDFAMQGSLYDVKDFNHRNGSEFLTDNAVVFATGDDLGGGSFAAEFLKAFISTEVSHRSKLFEFGCEKGWEEYHEGFKTLVILSPMCSEGNLMQIIQNYNLRNPDTKVVVLNWNGVQPRLRHHWDKTLHYMAGKPIFYDVKVTNPTQCLIGVDRAVKVHQKGNSIALFNLYDRDGAAEHPYLQNPDAFKSYTDYRFEVEEQLEETQDNPTRAILSNDETTMLIGFYRALTCQNVLDIEIGGHTHEQRANGTVYEDAMGAALSAVEDGLMLGGYGRLVALDHGHVEVCDAIEDVLFATLRADIKYDLVIALEKDQWAYLYADRNKCIDAIGHTHISVRTLDITSAEAFLKCTPECGVLIQSWSGYHEQFTRFLDILPKLANTTALNDMRSGNTENLH